MIKERVDIRLMGSEFELIVVDKDTDTAALRLQEGVAEIRRIETMLTEFSDTSTTARLNKQAGEGPQEVEAETYQLIARCIRLSVLTQGAFDITAGVIKRLYKFKERGKEFPAPELLAEAMTSVGYRHIRLLPGHRVQFSRPGMRIGFGAIGKGYAADRVRSLWKAAGVKSGVINASGDLTAWGRQPDGRPWRIGIVDPRNTAEFLLWLTVQDAAVATSGNYEQYVEIDGVRYSHNIDPRSGWPVRHVKSVTIVSPSAELSDALATAVTVMGKEAGLDLVNQFPRTHGILIDDQDRVFTSKKIKVHDYFK